ncbi:MULTISPECIES: hypothetical protein [Shewanella]|uniref:Magnesium transporter MgtE intracellular domain-containing protein n=2 Tax=Shewanella TaxID=22 RepID=A0ABU9UTN4_9GAMM|nr:MULTISPECIES: hypothetical protein [Shewanella]AEG10019.1 hypothetical protein Sbal175_0736 [Shewanella baltica BA175]EHQ16452.1 hypothetical protein Sbal183_3572 [Shewanella baltica OS183]MDT3297431.1 hypothetical protein [Shewanella sp. SP2S2-6]
MAETINPEFKFINNLTSALAEGDQAELINLIISTPIADLVQFIPALEIQEIVELFSLLPAKYTDVILSNLPSTFIKKLSSNLNNFNSENQMVNNIKKLIYERLSHNNRDYDLSNKYFELKDENMKLQIENVKLQEDFKAKLQKELSEKIDKNLSEYVNSAINSLKANRRVFNSKADNWKLYGFIAFSSAIFVSLLSAACATYYLLYSGYKLDWVVYSLLSIKVLIVISLACAFSNYAYSVSKAYIHEALIRVDREHAIRFGEMFLNIYGDRLEQAEVKSVFENWNFSSNSAFNITEKNKEPATDLNKSVELISKIMELTKLNK